MTNYLPYKNKVILLVEDHALCATVSKIILSELGCQVDIALNGEMAIQKVKNKAYDLIFMDIGLPDLSGYEVTKQIRLNEVATEKPVPIIALTAHIADKDRERCKEVGMNKILIKPMLNENALDILHEFFPTITKRYEHV